MEWDDKPDLELAKQEYESYLAHARIQYYRKRRLTNGLLVLSAAVSVALFLGKHQILVDVFGLEGAPFMNTVVASWVRESPFRPLSRH